jgi:2-keto-4-pentenoate hydratase
MDDPRVVQGMRGQLADRARDLAAGTRPRGWKLGLGAPAVLERLSLSGPLVGYLTESRVLESPATCEISSWTRAAAEPEIAVHIGADVAPDADDATAAAAIAGLGPAIELVDFDQPMDDVEAILLGNIFHRHVILGAPSLSESDLVAHIAITGQPAQTIEDPLAVVGAPGGAVRHVASVLDAFGETLRAGDVIITGSVLLPPVSLTPGDLLEYRVGVDGEVLSLTLT